MQHQDSLTLPTVPTLVTGALATDDRGCVRFVNEFNFVGVKRFYQVENFSTETIRAWHGHLNEGKYVYVPRGSAIVAAVPLSNVKKPNKKAIVSRFVLSALKPSILFIPAGFANGFKALEANTSLCFFSTSTLEESKGDDYRFPHNYWGEAVWETEHR